MNRSVKFVLAAAWLAAPIFVGGCAVRVEGPDVGPPPGPVVYDDYYYHGYYDGPNYYWYDRGGHLMHEAREYHERREQLAHRPHAQEHRGAIRGHADEHGGEHRQEHH